MAGKVFLVFALLVALLVSGAASSLGDARDTNEFQQLLAKRMKVRDSAVKKEPTPHAHSPRTQRRAHLSEEEREIMTKQVMQAISEMMTSDCMLDRDYQGWVDFGRRDTE
ncbi:uncharacterized protein LOC121509130 [Cheilinus undulatus]|uniref:uncharacterized protein LOC121509130 n=1 Tax=Cheilinus undulatus TaxID=241271 RepID=UPI001BD47551|nr:uncharacterized protein LOC121509130 [Cheilinus undulatus]